MHTEPSETKVIVSQPDKNIRINSPAANRKTSVIYP